MADYIQGVNPTQVDTTAQFPLGQEAMDPRVKDFPQNIIKYVRAQSAVALNDAVHVDVGQTDEPNAVIPTSAADQRLEGVAHVAIGAGSFGWITIHGRVPAVKVAAATAAGVTLMTTATAGTLGTTVGGVVANALAQGRTACTLDAESGGVAEAYIY